MSVSESVKLKFESTKSQRTSQSQQVSLCFGGHTHSVTEHKPHTVQVQPKVCAQLQPPTAVPTAASTFVPPRPSAAKSLASFITLITPFFAL
jgi:hypothetical protein